MTSLHCPSSSSIPPPLSLSLSPSPSLSLAYLCMEKMSNFATSLMVWSSLISYAYTVHAMAQWLPRGSSTRFYDFKVTSTVCIYIRTLHMHGSIILISECFYFLFFIFLFLSLSLSLSIYIYIYIYICSG
jgi:hypothetical protein